jgi:heme exporter protein A
MGSGPAANAAMAPLAATTPRVTPAVELSAVSRVFGVVPGIVRVSLSIAPGETILLRGPNGAGKSTLLRIVATLLAPTYGAGAVLGFDLVRERSRIRPRIELVGHATRLYEDLTAAENLRFVCALYGLDPSGVRAALDGVSLGWAAGDRVRGFSQGMRQRLAVARVLLRRPDLLLLDEPYAGLDVASKDVVDRAIVEAQGEGRTVVLATHDPGRGAMAGRTLLLDRGRIVGEERS